MKEDYQPAKRQIEISPGKSLKIVRELQELSQNQLAELTGIQQSSISAMENGRTSIGVERAKVLAKALHVHPAVLIFPNWENEAA
jgi:transcriptional regulator with XRE-family HTH domain